MSVVYMLAESIRGHWEVENRAYWVMDMVYKEGGTENMAILRRTYRTSSRENQYT